MPYCKKCGELGRADKCKKCGTALHTSPSSLSQYFNVGRWQSRDTEKKSLFTTVATVKTGPSTIFDKKHRIAPIPSYPVLSSTSSTPPEHPKSPQTTDSPQPSSSSSLSTSSKQSNECTQCHQQLSGKLVQLIDDDDDEGKKYHWSCLLCFECHQPFHSTDLYLNVRQQLYHPECIANSPILDRSCSHCKSSILDKYLCIHTSVLHPECFRCTGCQNILKSASIYCYKSQAQVFCRPCHHIHFPQDQYTISNEAQWKVVPQPHQRFVKATSQVFYHDANSPKTLPSVTPSSSSSALINSSQRSLILPTMDHPVVVTSSNPVHPSELIRAKNLGGGHKRRPLPRFGAIKVCPGCQSRITSIHEECTGPRAAKWHRQCLVCSSCRKSLDSSAKIHQTPENDLVPTCTTCLLKRKTVNQKNNSDFMKEWCQI